jgi:two-component system, NarL family, sensor histidine kinase UhpB
MTLYWRVLWINSVLLIGMAAIVALVHERAGWPVSAYETQVLVGGFVGVVVADAVVLRPSFMPLEALVTRMKRVDLLDSYEPVRPARNRDVAALVDAFNEMLLRLEAERRASARRELAAQEDERKRVAMALHDEVGQTMTALLMQLGRVHDLVSGRARRDLADAQDAIRSCLQEVRRIAQDLRPEMLEELGLVSALTALAEGFADRTGIQVDFRYGDGLPRLDPAAELMVFRVVQESLTNVARHAGARRVWLTVRRCGRRIVVRVLDDGRGFTEPPPKHSGLRGMRERAVAAGGELTAENSAGGGVEIRLTIPVDG